MTKIQAILDILYEQHNVVMDKSQCKKLIKRYRGRVTLTKLVNYIIEKRDDESSESISISSDSESYMYDFVFIKRFIFTACGLQMSNAIVKYYIDQYAKYDGADTDLKIAECLVLPEYLRHDRKLIQELIDTQSVLLLKRLLGSHTNGWLLIYFIYEQTDDIVNLIKQWSEPYNVDVRYIKTHTEELCMRLLAEDHSIFKYIKIAQTAEMCLLAVRKCGLNIERVSSEFLTEDLCVKAVAQNHYSMMYIPKKYKTANVWLNYLLNDVFGFYKNIGDLPKKYSTSKFFECLFTHFFKRYAVKGCSNGVDLDGVLSRAKYIPQEFQSDITKMINTLSHSGSDPIVP